MCIHTDFDMRVDLTATERLAVPYCASCRVAAEDEVAEVAAAVATVTAAGTAESVDAQERKDGTQGGVVGNWILMSATPTSMSMF